MRTSSPPPPESPGHPIRVVARRTGLSADVIRAWEKRHAVVTPARAANGRRLYSDADVERLRLVARATLTGRTVAQAAALPPEALADAAREAVTREAVARDPAARDAAAAPEVPNGDGARPAALAHLRACLDAVARFDGMGLDAALRRATVALSAEAFLDAIVVRLWERVAEGVHRGTLR